MPLGYCPAILDSLDNYSGQNNLATKLPHAGALYALLDPQNTGDLEIGAEGHVRGADNTDAARYSGVDVLGKPSMLLKYKVPNQATVQSVKDCTSNGAPVDSESSFTLQLYKQKTVTFRLARIANLCRDASKLYVAGRGNTIERKTVNTGIMNEVASTISTEMGGLVAAVDADIWTRLVAGIGTNAGNLDVDGVTPLATTQSLTMLNADGSLNYLAYDKLANDAMFNYVDGKPIVIGGKKFASFARAAKFGCCTSAGIDYAKVYANDPFMFYFDDTADTALGAGQFLMIAPGSVQFVKHNYYDNPEMFGQVFGLSEYGLFRDSRLPLTWDFEVRKSNCPDPSIDVVISLFYDVWIKPSVYTSGVLVGNRGTYRYTAT